MTSDVAIPHWLEPLQAVLWREATLVVSIRNPRITPKFGRR
jgi:hypothetical protein